MSETTIGVNAQVGYKNYELKTLSGQFVVPPSVFRIRLGAQSAGSSGWSSPGGSSSFASGGKGGNAGNYIAAEFDVRPGDIITYVIGAGGISSGVNNFQPGGDTFVKIGDRFLLWAQGGNNVEISLALATCTNFELVLGGLGGSNVNGGKGGLPRFTDKQGFNSQHVATQYNGIVIGIPESVGGQTSNGTAANGAGGGGSSRFGRGGHGGVTGSPGQAAPANNYGAGGGGGGGSTMNNWNLGGDGTQGCVEIWY